MTGAPPEPGAPKALILLVDDCADTRDLYTEGLESSFAVAHAPTGADALEKASELRPSAIVMDLMLSDMSGEAAIARLKSNARTRHIPVVVLSGFTEPTRLAPAWEAYFRKPCPPETLAAYLAQLLR